IPVSKPGDQGFEGPVGQTYTQMRNMAYNYASDDELKSIFPTYVTAVSHKTMSALDTLHEMQRHPWTDATGEDSMPVPSTDLKTYYEQGLAEFLTGKRELTKANWASFIKQLDQIGATAWEEAGRVYAEQNNLLK
ncbi:MAG: ABC transporter substrate-binding protein, partial [Sphaerochaetaceae bacterium]|nr:ABC transporter substrate-binding protein [Sphaerochaetaceae bacterium]